MNTNILTRDAIYEKKKIVQDLEHRNSFPKAGIIYIAGIGADTLYYRMVDANRTCITIGFLSFSQRRPV